MQIKGSTAIITGSGTGIGRAIALELGRRGARVVSVGRRAHLVEETVRLIEEAGGTALAAPTDITEADQVERLVERTLEHFEHIDVLFNNAGSFNSIAGVFEADLQVWWRDVTVNLLGAMHCIRAVLPLMMQRNRGVIINMNGGRPAGGTGYACGKAGLMELSRVMAAELKMGKSNVITLSAGPGLVRTEMTQLQAESEAGQKWIPSTVECFASGDLRKPEETAFATAAALEAATPQDAGKSFGPDTDFSKW